MNRKFLSVVLSMMLIVTSCFLPCTSVAAIGTDDTAQSNASVEIAESNADDTVELVFYSYLMDGVSQPGHKQYVQQQKKVVKANRGDEIKLKVNMKAKDEPYLSTLSIRYDLTEEDDIEGLFGKNGLMESSQANFIANHIPRRNKSLLQYKSIKMNDVIQSKCDKYYDDGDIFYDLGAFSQYSLSDKFDAFSIIPSEFISDSSAEFAQMKEDMHFTESEGGDEYCTITFKVSEDTSLGNQQTCVIYAPEFQKAIAQGNVVQVTEMTMDVTGSSYSEPATEKPTEKPTAKPTEKPTTPPTGDKAIIHLVDDNARETLVLNVGDTFEYPVYVKLDSARVYAMTARTYFNQPVGTRNKPNAEGYMEPNAPKVLDIVSKRNDISAYWKNLDTSTDVIKDSRGYELCMSPIGAYDSTTGKFNNVETYYGAFNQASGCLLYKVKFTVMEPGEVEVFTFMDEAIAKYTENSAGVIIPTKANYVAIYNEEQKEVPTEKPTEITTEAGQAIIHIVDDNKREPLVLNVGDTFEYPVYVKLDSAKVYAMTARTYFNQPVGTKNKPNAEGSMEPNAPKVLDIKSKRNDIGAYWDNLDTSTDVIKDSRGYELCMSPIGAYNASTSKFSYVETHNGDFDQAGGCLLYKVKFTVMAPGEVEVFTHIEEAIADYTENSEGVVIPTHANYVAIYNQGKTVDSIKYLVGDCNGDGQVSTADLIYMQRYKLGVLSLSEKGLLGADVNCDGAVTLKDISMLQRYYIYVRYDDAPINTWKTYNP